MDREEYGTNYQAHLLEEYKLYVEMADRVSQRRAVANDADATAECVNAIYRRLTLGDGHPCPS